MDLAKKIIHLHQALSRAKLPHAFGGALALAWCTRRARGTMDIDINILVPVDELEKVLAGLPAAIKVTAQDRRLLKQDGQARLWWDKTPVDVFLNTTSIHTQLHQKVRWEKFSGHDLPFLSCHDLAVFKAFFNRTRDWADLEEMQLAGTLDISAVRAVLLEQLGAEDERIVRLNKLKKM